MGRLTRVARLCFCTADGVDTDQIEEKELAATTPEEVATVQRHNDFNKRVYHLLNVSGSLLFYFRLLCHSKSHVIVCALTPRR